MAIVHWTGDCLAPWQTPEFLEQMREQSRPNAFRRQWLNQWVSSESSFIELAWWDACVDDNLSPALVDPSLSVWVGVDASVKRDSTAIVCCTFDQEKKKVRLVWHRIWQPSRAEPLDFERTIEKCLLDMRRRFWIREVRFDPYQMQSTAQRLAAAGVPMLEFPQTVSNLTEASTNLYELLKGRNLIVYADDDLRLAISRCIAIETSRGWRIAKEKASHKIDVIVALAQACLGAVGGGQAPVATELTLVTSDGWSSRWQERGSSHGSNTCDEADDLEDSQGDADIWLSRGGSGPDSTGLMPAPRGFGRRTAY
jgi:phage terminase large subunit-like protein